MADWLRDKFTNVLVRFVVGPGLLVVGGLIPAYVVKVPLMLLGAGMVAGANIVADRVVKQAERVLRQEDARQTVQRLLATAVRSIEAGRPVAADRTLRANLMLLDRAEGGLRVALSTGGYSHAECQLIWYVGQGCAGVAWESGQTVVAPQDGELPVSIADVTPHNRPWNMTDLQIQVVGYKLRSVLSAPVFLPTDLSRPVGVLNFDDSRPLGESQLATSCVLEPHDLGVLLVDGHVFHLLAQVAAFDEPDINQHLEERRGVPGVADVLVALARTRWTTARAVAKAEVAEAVARVAAVVLGHDPLRLSEPTFECTKTAGLGALRGRLAGVLGAGDAGGEVRPVRAHGP